MEFVLDVGKKYPEITGPISDAFANELRKIVRSGEFEHLVLDFGGTRMISSMAMGSIFKEYTDLKTDNKTLRVVNASPKVQHLFQMVNMADLLG